MGERTWRWIGLTIFGVGLLVWAGIWVTLVGPAQAHEVVCGRIQTEYKTRMDAAREAAKDRYGHVLALEWSKTAETARMQALQDNGC